MTRTWPGSLKLALPACKSFRIAASDGFRLAQSQSALQLQDVADSGTTASIRLLLESSDGGVG
jgi:hypothetical protein